MTPLSVQRLMRHTSPNNGGKGQRGFVFIPVVMAIILIAAIAYLMNTRGAMHVNNVGQEMDIAEARYAAHAGANHILWQSNQAGCTGYSDLSNVAFGDHNYSATIAPASNSPVSITATGTHANGARYEIHRDRVKIYQFPTQQLALQPDAGSGKDTYLYEWNNSGNYGGSTTLWVRNDVANSAASSLFYFDVGTVPPEAKIVSAILELWQNTSLSNGGTVGVRKISSDWIEGNATGGAGVASWDDRDSGVAWVNPGGDSSSLVYARTNIPAGTVGWYPWDISNLVSDWVGAVVPNQGLMLTPESTNTYVAFDSSDSANSTQRPKLTIIYACECGGACGVTAPQLPPVFEEFTEAKGSSGTQLTIAKPSGTAPGDLLIAMLVADDNKTSSMSAPAGWNEISIADHFGIVTLGVWWKLAAASEGTSYSFSWSGSENTYGAIMRFTGHDSANPIQVSATAGGRSSNPYSPAVTTSVENTLIVRLGGFDDNDISVDAPGLLGHSVITMDRSTGLLGAVSGGAGYLVQSTSGNSGTSSFALTGSEQYRTVTIGITPAP